MPRHFWAIAAATFLCVTSAQSSDTRYYDKPEHTSADKTKTSPAPVSAESSASLTKTGVGLGLVSNGGFETNGGAGTADLTDWTIVNQGNGSWYAQTGTSSPTRGVAVQAPTEGSFAAMTDQSSTGSHVLFQQITVPAEGATLHFDLYLRNHAADYYVPDPATLDHTVNPNQQFRADIMDPAAGDFDVGAGVLDNIYQTRPGDPLESGYTTVSHSLDAFAGQTIRLRFAEVDNQFYFNVGVDNVHVTGKPAVGMTPDSLDFGDQEVGTTSAPASVTLENTGSADLEISAVGTPSAPFAAASGTCGAAPFALTAGESCTLAYDFSPSAAGPAADTISIDSNAPGSPDSFPLAGNGIQSALSLSSGSVNFGTIHLGTSDSTTVTVINTGSAPLEMTGLSGLNEPFNVTGGSCVPVPTTVPVDGSCTVEIGFNGAGNGSASDTLVIESNAPGNPHAVAVAGAAAFLEAIPVSSPRGLVLLALFIMLMGVTAGRRRLG